jgi:hypothetical protein
MAYDWTSSTIFSAPYTGIEGQSIYALDANNLFIVFSDWDTYKTYFSKSIDGGNTWSTPVVIDNAQCAYDLRERSIWTSTDGQTIYIIYAGDDSWQIHFSKSIDGGISFSNTVVDGVGYDTPACWKPNMDVINNGQYIYAVYPKTYGAYYAVNLAYSLDSGSTWAVKEVRAVDASEKVYAIKALSIDTIYIAGDIHPVQIPSYSYRFQFAKTSDRGDSWSFTDIATTNIFDCSMYVKDANTILIASSANYTPENRAFKLAKSIDGGVSFTYAIFIDPDDVYYGYTSSMFSPDGGDTMMVSYHDDYPGVCRLKFAYSVDDGDTWTVEVADDFDYCGYFTSLFAVSNAIFIVHSTPAGASECDYCLRLTKAAISSLPISSIYHKWHEPVVII